MQRDKNPGRRSGTGQQCTKITPTSVYCSAALGAIARPNFAAVAAVALASADAILARWLPGGKRQGEEYIALNTTRSDNHLGSLSINVSRGIWKDFATDDGGGDLISLVAYLDGVSQSEAARRLADFLNLDPTAVPPPKGNGNSGGGWTPIIPIPKDAPPPLVAHPRYSKPARTWLYRDPQGRSLCYVYRFDVEPRKQILPLTFCQGPDGRLAWRWQALPPPRPLYHLDALAARPDVPVVVCEGEKAADAAAALFPDGVTTTAPNGAQSPGKADWSPLAGRRVWVWPDHDAPGRAFAAAVAKLAQQAGAAEVWELRIQDGLDRLPRQDAEDKPTLTPRPEDNPLPEGWDAADALAEGWTAEHIQRLLRDPANLIPPQGPTAPAATAKPEAKPDPAADAIIPLRRRFRVDEKGVWYRPLLDKEGKQPPDVWVCAPLQITAATRDADRDNHGHLLAFKDRHGHPHQWAMPLELLEDRREYRRVLRRLGLTLNGSRDSNELLQTYLEVCHATVTAICVSKIGWHESAYVLPDETLNDTGQERVLLQTLSARIEGYRQAGTLEDWKTHVARLCVGNSRLLLAASMGFAAPLLPWTGDESGGIHYRGSSSSGKTTAGYAARSVWGEIGALETWRATLNGLEGVAEHHNDNLLVLDELKQVDPREAGEIAYMLANGTGKRRGQKQGGVHQRITWRLLFLSTGELSLEQHMQEAGKRSYAGQEARLVDLPADAGQGLGVFEQLHGYPDGAAFAKAIKTAAGQYHGTAGRAFIQAFGKDIPRAVEKVNELRDAFIKANVPNEASGQVHRVASRIGLNGAAGELATRYGITGWPEGAAMEAARRCLLAWIEGRGGVGDAEIEQALSQVWLFFEKHGEARFTPWHDKEGRCTRCRGSGFVDFTYKQGKCFECHGTGKIDEQRRLSVSNRAGFRRPTDDGRSEYYVFPEVFRKEICAGQDAGQVTKLLVEHGLLLPDSDGKATRQERLPGIGKKRVYRFTADILGGRDNDTAT